MTLSLQRSLVCAAALMLSMASANAMSTAELQAEYASVLASCNSDAGSLAGASRTSFILKCRTAKTSPEAKAKSCEMQMASEISAKAQRDPAIRDKYIQDCVKRWNPKIG